MESKNIYIQVAGYLFNKDIVRSSGIIGKVKTIHMRNVLLKQIGLYSPSLEYTSLYKFCIDFINFYNELNRGFAIEDDKDIAKVLKLDYTTGTDNSSTTYYRLRINISDGWEKKIDLKKLEINFNNTDREVIYSYDTGSRVVKGSSTKDNSALWSQIGLGVAHVLKIMVKTLDKKKPMYYKEPYHLVKLEIVDFEMTATTPTNRDNASALIRVIPGGVHTSIISPIKKAIDFPVEGEVYLEALDKAYSFEAHIHAYYNDYNGEDSDSVRVNKTIHNLLNREIIFNFKNFNGWLYDIVYSQAVAMSGVDLNDQ